MIALMRRTCLKGNAVQSEVREAYFRSKDAGSRQIVVDWDPQVES